MKSAKIIVSALLLIPFYVFSQGSTCGTAIALTLDGVCRDYTTSTSTGTNLLCAGSSSTITWFSFTTNSVPDNIQINITDPSGQPMEIAMYTACTGSNTYVPGSSMCFDDGKGIWAPEEIFNLVANTTYRLRIKTGSATSLSICAKHYTPPNDNCTGAFAVGTDPVPDNNSTHKGGPGVWASELCANTLENTAFYYYYVLNTGTTIININDIECDNQNANNSPGFQIGFFTGNCSALVPLSCTNGTGSFVQGTTPVLNAGTRVTVAIDGYAGSNCSYTLQGFNVQVLQTSHLKNFRINKSANSNILNWQLKSEHPFKKIEVQRAGDNAGFSTMEIITINDIFKIDYSFTDESPFYTGNYRLVFYDENGKKSFSHVIQVRRGSIKDFDLWFSNMVSSQLSLKIQTGVSGRCNLLITGMNGQVMFKNEFNLNSGINFHNKDMSILPKGQYILRLQLNNSIITKTFYKN